MANSIFDSDWSPETSQQESNVSIFDEDWTAESEEETIVAPEQNFEAYNIIRELDGIEQDSLTERAILDNKNLVEGIRNIMKARYSEETRNKFSFDERYDRDMSDKDLIQEWQNWMRSLTGGQTVTTGNDVAWFAMADDEQRALMGASFEIMDKMPGIFKENVTWAETFDGMRDYGRAAIWDPSTVLGLGIGRLFTKASSKTAGFAMRKAAQLAYKNALKRGMTQEQAKKVRTKVIKNGFRKAGMKEKLPPVIAGMSTDAAIAVGTDQLYQGLRIGSGVQDSRSLPQSVGAALGVIVVPALTVGTKTLAKGMGEVLNFKTYVDISSKFAGRSGEEITEQVMERTDIKLIDTNLRKMFADFSDNIDTYLPWSKARDQAKETVKKADIDGSSAEMEDLFESVFLFGKPEEGLTQKGLIYSMAEAGFVYVPRGKDDNVSNFIGDAIKYLPDETVKSTLASFKKQFNLKGTKLGKIKTGAELSDWFKNRSRFAGKTMFNRKAALDILNKDIDNITLEDMLNLHKVDKPTEKALATPADRVKYIQSLWKRALTSHPSTTGLNIKGWGYTTSLNNISDVVLAAVLGLQGRGQEAKGSILGAARRGFNVLDYDATIEQGLNYLKFRPEVGEELLSEVSGGVESKNVLERLNLDPKSKINQATEKTISGIQAATGVKLQDEVTKMISFMSAMDQNIMKVYGVNYNQFMKRKDAFVEMHTKKFLDEVQTPAIDRAKKETYSFSWLNKKGDGLFLGIAKNVEKFSNSAGGGFLIPFGRFFNTATAMFGDYSGFNALKHVTSRVYKLDNPFDDEGQVLLSKGIVGASVIFGPRLSMGGSSEYEAAKERVRNGEAWNFDILPDGSRRDYTYDAPQNYPRIIAQALAHRQIDGRIPDPLKEEMFELFIGQTFRQTGEVYDTFKDYFSTVLDSDLEDSFMASVELLSGAFSRIASGSTRFLEPINTFAMYATGDFASPDRRQGNKLLNESVRYVDKIPQMFGIEGSDLPDRKIATRDRGNFDAGRVALGARGDRGASPAERVAASVGKASWKALMFEGEPELKNRLDDFVQEVFNLEASKLIEEGFLEKPLAKREEAYSRLVNKVKNRAKTILASSPRKDDSLLELERQVLSKSKRLKRDVLDHIEYDGEITDIKNEEGGREKLEFILYLMKYADEIIYAD